MGDAVVWRDRGGVPISFDQAKKLIRETRYIRVARTRLAVDDTEYLVSTIWLGGAYDGMLFETFVFSDDEKWDCTISRYPSEDIAKVGHAGVVGRIEISTGAKVVSKPEDVKEE